MVCNAGYRTLWPSDDGEHPTLTAEYARWSACFPAEAAGTPLPAATGAEHDHPAPFRLTHPQAGEMEGSVTTISGGARLVRFGRIGPVSDGPPDTAASDTPRPRAAAVPIAR